jgi:hypothetical protein
MAAPAPATIARRGDPLVGFSTALPSSSNAPTRGIQFAGAGEGSTDASGIRREGVILFAENVFRQGAPARERRLVGLDAEARN